MKQNKIVAIIMFTFGCITLTIGFLASNIALFRWVENGEVQSLFGIYTRYVLVSGAVSAIISGGLLMKDALDFRRGSLHDYGLQDKQIPRKQKSLTKLDIRRRIREGISFLLITVLFLSYCTTVLSLVTYTSIAYAEVGLFFDDFEEHTPPELPDRWTVLAGTWQTSLNGTIVYMQAKKNIERTISTAGNPNWTDYVLEVKVEFNFPPGTPPSTGANIYFRFQNLSNYYFLYMDEDQDEMRLYRRVNGVESQIGPTMYINLVTNQWYHVEVSIEDQSINVWVDDIQYFTDQASGGTLIAGAIGVGTKKYCVSFDEVEVSPIS